ncbi:hypothetical protein ACWKSP_05725 [Micromonosporaceae bacterium Da 78-11]
MNVVAEMVLTEPTPALIWAMLMLLSLPAMLLLGSPQALHNPGRFLVDSVAVLRRHRDRRVLRHQEAENTVRYADELTVAAARATQAAAQWHERWQETEHGAETAWQTWQDAEQLLTRTRGAAAFATSIARTPAEYADRERFLHRTVRDAVDRGDLPATALTDACAGRGGWNPWLHPAEQELAVRQAVAAHRHHLYLQAAAAERTAWHDTVLAASTRASLQQEALTAMARAARIRTAPSTRKPTTSTARRPAFARATA